MTEQNPGEVVLVGGMFAFMVWVFMFGIVWANNPSINYFYWILGFFLLWGSFIMGLWDYQVTGPMR